MLTVVFTDAKSNDFNKEGIRLYGSESTMKFIQRYQGWFILLIVLNVMTNLLLSLHAGLALVSFIYFNLLYIVLSTGFVVARYIKDRQQLVPSEKELLPQQVPHLAEQQVEQSELLHQTHVEPYHDEQLACMADMKAPLTTLQCMIEEMEHSETKRKLEQEWLRLSTLLDRQLDIVRLQTIEQHMQLEEVALRELVVGEMHSFKVQCLEKGISFDLENLEKTVLMDRTWLGYILRQLISNAVKYSHPQSEISIYAKHDAEERLVVYVRDAGKGIAAQDLPHVLQKSSNTSGMGLYLAKQAADKMGLQLTIDSAIGLGTTVKIQFPKQHTYIEVGV